MQDKTKLILLGKLKALYQQACVAEEKALALGQDYGPFTMYANQVLALIDALDELPNLDAFYALSEELSVPKLESKED